jgi:hypothetical protein
MVDILKALKATADDMEYMEAPGEWVLPVTQAHSVIVRQQEEIERLKAALRASIETLAAKEAETRRLHVALETANANCDRMAALAIDNAKDTERLRAALERILADAKDMQDAFLLARAALAQPAEGEKHD